MLVDPNQATRQKAVNLILENRQKSLGSVQPIRKFMKPKLKFDAPTYHEMVNIQSTEPPLTQKMSHEMLKSCMENEDNAVKNALNGIPNHTQAVERFVQLVSQSSKRVVGADQRNQLICSTIASRDILPKMNSKKDYADYLKK